jgi:hypothetical protein
MRRQKEVSLVAMFDNFVKKLLGRQADEIKTEGYGEGEHFVADSFSFGVEREMKESGEKSGTEDINIGVGEFQRSATPDVPATDLSDPSGQSPAEPPMEELSLNYAKIPTTYEDETAPAGDLFPTPENETDDDRNDNAIGGGLRYSGGDGNDVVLGSEGESQPVGDQVIDFSRGFDAPEADASRVGGKMHLEDVTLGIISDKGAEEESVDDFAAQEEGPQESPGTMTVTGDYSLDSGDLYKLDQEAEPGLAAGDDAGGSEVPVREHISFTYQKIEYEPSHGDESPDDLTESRESEDAAAIHGTATYGDAGEQTYLAVELENVQDDVPGDLVQEPSEPEPAVDLFSKLKSIDGESTDGSRADEQGADDVAAEEPAAGPTGASFPKMLEVFQKGEAGVIDDESPTLVPIGEDPSGEATPLAEAPDFLDPDADADSLDTDIDV